MRKEVLSLTVLTASKNRMVLTLFVACLVGMVVLFGVGLRSAETQTTPSYYVAPQDLGTLGGSTSYAYDINDYGQVVGYSYTANGQYHAFLYDENATPKMKDLGTLGGTNSEAKAINNSGRVVGWSLNSSGEARPFIYDNTNGMKDLSTLIPADSGLTLEEATAINSDGKIAVTGYSYGDYYSASFLLTPATTATSTTYEVQGLPTLEGDYSTIDAMGINDPGKVIGKAWYDCYGCGDSHAFLYDSATQQMQDLGGYFSEATGINDSGKVVGHSPWRAFIYDSTNGMKDLGTLGGTYTQAKAINNSGQVVGRSDNSSGQPHAFIYDSTKGMKDLNTLVPADSGWTINEATAINKDGKIAATYYKAGVGRQALLLTPTSDIPSPTISSPKNNTYDSYGSFIVSGSAEAGSTVELFEGTTSTGKTTANSSTGAWSITLREVSEGAHTYFAKATDAAGNTSPASNSVSVTVDKTPPTVNSVSPSDRATGVSLSTTVTATFSEDMDPNTLNDTDTQTGNDKSFTLAMTMQGSTTAIPVMVSYDATTKTATLKPSSTLTANTRYTATVKGGASGAKDKAGNALASDKVWSFTTKK